jgi:hypothetical protein
MTSHNFVGSLGVQHDESFARPAAAAGDKVILLVLINSIAVMQKRSVALGGQPGEITINVGVGYTIHLDAAEMSILPGANVTYLFIDAGATPPAVLFSGTITVSGSTVAPAPDVTNPNLLSFHATVPLDEEFTYNLDSGYVIDEVFLVNSSVSTVTCSLYLGNATNISVSIPANSFVRKTLWDAGNTEAIANGHFVTIEDASAQIGLVVNSKKVNWGIAQ